MTYVVYILFSQSLDKYYVGYTTNLDARLAKHLSSHRGYTNKAKDWKVVFTQDCTSKSEAIILEKRIKNRGAQRFLEEHDKSG